MRWKKDSIKMKELMIFIVYFVFNCLKIELIDVVVADVFNSDFRGASGTIAFVFKCQWYQLSRYQLVMIVFALDATCLQ